MEQQPHNEQSNSTNQISRYQQPGESNISYLPISVTTKGVIDNGYDNKIRDLLRNNPVSLIQNATSVIGEVLTAYCGATTDGTHAGVVSECVALMTHKFSHLGIYEVREAYRLAAIDKIDVDITAYRGVATVYAFGQVMSAYDKLRNSYVAIIEQKKREQQELENQETEKKKKAFELQIMEWFVKSKADKGKSIKSFDDVPFYYFDTLSDAGSINISKEVKFQYMDKATVLLKNKFEINKHSTEKSDREFVRNVNELGAAQAYLIATKGSQAEIISLAKKLLLYDIIKGNLI